MMTDPTVVLAERVWPIPELAPRQNRIILPLLVYSKDWDYGVLADVAFVALTRAHPNLTKAEFDGLPIPQSELVEALPVIKDQTGFFHKNPKPQTVASTPELPDWDSIIAEFCNFLPGTTPDYWEDALTAKRLEAQYEEWRKHPPVAVLVAGYLKYRPPAKMVSTTGDPVLDLLRLFPDGNLRLN
jgi:hypothetical protein